MGRKEISNEMEKNRDGWKNKNQINWDKNRK